MKSKKLLMVTDEFYPSHGGSPAVALEVAAALVSRGNQVTVLARNRGERLPSCEQLRGIRVIRYPVRSRRVPFQFVETLWRARAYQARIVRDHGIDTLISHHVVPGYGSYLLQERLNCRHIHYFHGPAHKEYAAAMGAESWAENGKQRGAAAALWDRVVLHLLRLFQSRIVRSANANICLSEYMSREAEELAAPKQSVIEKIPGGTNTGLFVPVSASVRSDLRELYGIPREGPLLLTVRRLVRRTGVDLLIEAFVHIRQHIVNAVLVVCGDGVMLPVLRESCGRLGLTDSVILKGFVPGEHLIRYHQMADLFAMPSKTLEGFGLSLLDSFACAVPAIGTPVGGIPEVLNSVDESLVAGAIDSCALANCAMLQLRDCAKLAGIGKHGREVCERMYTWDRIGALVEQVV